MAPSPAQVCILITDGKSQDLVDAAAQRLKGQGVKLFAVGEHPAGVVGCEGRDRPEGVWAAEP